MSEGLHLSVICVVVLTGLYAFLPLTCHIHWALSIVHTTLASLDCKQMVFLRASPILHCSYPAQFRLESF